MQLFNEQITKGNADAAAVKLRFYQCLSNVPYQLFCIDPNDISIEERISLIALAQKSIYSNCSSEERYLSSLPLNPEELDPQIRAGNAEALTVRLSLADDSASLDFIRNTLPALNQKLSLQMQVALNLFGFYGQQANIKGAMEIIRQHQLHIFDLSFLADKRIQNHVAGCFQGHPGAGMPRELYVRVILFQSSRSFGQGFF